MKSVFIYRVVGGILTLIGAATAPLHSAFVLVLVVGVALLLGSFFLKSSVEAFKNGQELAKREGSDE